MSSDTPQAKFDGWAIVDVLGHQRYVGYVTTEAYGAAVLFRVDVPALDARERTTKQPGWLEGRGSVPAGTVVQEGAVDGYTKLIGSGSIYTLTPCTKDAALAALEAMQHRPLMEVRLPSGVALPPAPRHTHDDDFLDDILNGGDEAEDDDREEVTDMENPQEGAPETEAPPPPATSAQGDGDSGDTAAEDQAPTTADDTRG